MKVGDLVIMPMESRMAGDSMSIGLVVDETDPRTPKSWARKTKRIGVMWTDGGGVVDFEPKDWLEVISESR